MGYAGNDTLIGGAGIDAAVYAGNFAGCTIARAGDRFTATDKSGAEGTDTVLAALSQSAENIDGLAPVIGAGFEYTPYGA